MPNPLKRFTCHHPGCTSSYQRKEHLHRHQAQHSGRLASACPFCSRTFARRDTLRRHVRRDHADSQSQLASARAMQACEGCRGAKVRCQGGSPCARCRMREIRCVFGHSAPIGAEHEHEREPEADADADADLDASASQTGPSQQQGKARADQEEQPVEYDSPNLAPGLASPKRVGKDKTQHCVSLYFTQFHPQWPILHRGTFDIAHEPPFLVQAVVMVGLWVSGTSRGKRAAMELHEKLGLSILEQRSNWAKTDCPRDEAGEEGYQTETEDTNPTSQWPIATYQGILIYLIFSLVSSGTKHALFELSLTFHMSPCDRSILSALVETCLENNIFYYPRMLERYRSVEDITCIWVGVEEIKRLGLGLFRICCLWAGGNQGELLVRPGMLGPNRLLCLSDLRFPPPDRDYLWEAGSNEELSRLLRYCHRNRHGNLEQDGTGGAQPFQQRASSLMSAQSFRQIIGLPPSTATTTDSTLIIIDAQNEYAQGHLKVQDADKSRKVIADLLSRYRAAGAAQHKNIVHVVHQTPPGAPVFTPNTPLAEEFAELKPESGEKVIVKNFPSSFAQTDLHEYLQSLGGVGKKIVLAGYMAHVCVSTTARAGAELGYEVLVVRDGVGDRAIPGVEADALVDVALKEIGDAFGTVVASGDIKD
ncbi:Isochorismatase family-domain-containing protein [Aspergillus navahoensis]